MSADKTTHIVIQISDTHLFSDPNDQLMSYQTHLALSKTIDHILENQPTPNLLLVTGDISQDESANSYLLAQAQFKRLGCPVYWIQGNHDDEYQINTSFNESSQLKKLSTLSVGDWAIITINTCTKGTDKGYIDLAEYDRFAARLEEQLQHGKSIAVVMHHHPLPVDTPLIDEYILQESERFLKIIRGSKSIKLIICGHVHGDYSIPYHHSIIETCPATCFQWIKGSKDIATEDSRGYKVYQFDSAEYSVKTFHV